jgi:ribosomal protein S18 acetylase RimI-like enzyme
VTDVLVRPATAADFAEVARLTVAAYRADGQLGDDLDSGYARVLTDVAARAAVADVLVAEVGQQVVGAVAFALPGTPYAELAAPGEAEFRMLAVDPSAQGRGVGETLVHACLARARELGRRAVVICSPDFSAPAHRLYARLGFVRVPGLDRTTTDGIRLLALRLDLR